MVRDTPLESWYERGKELSRWHVMSERYQREATKIRQNCSINKQKPPKWGGLGHQLINTHVN